MFLISLDTSYRQIPCIKFHKSYVKQIRSRIKNDCIQCTYLVNDVSAVLIRQYFRDARGHQYSLGMLLLPRNQGAMSQKKN